MIGNMTVVSVFHYKKIIFQRDLFTLFAKELVETTNHINAALKDEPNLSWIGNFILEI